MSPREAASVIISLSGLRSASAEVLRELADSLMRRPGQSPAVPPQHKLAQTTDATYQPSSSTTPSPSTSASSAPGLTRLSSSELAQVVSALAAFNVRPGDAWLGACMSCLQLGLPGLPGAQLCQLLWALVQLGVRPTTPWLALYEAALTDVLTASASAPANELAEADKVSGDRIASGGVRRAAAAQPGTTAMGAGCIAGGTEVLGCEDLVRLLTALAQIGFQPGERCRAALLAASAGRLRGMAAHQVAGLAWAVRRLGWRVDRTWSREFLQVTAALLPQLKPSDLPPVVSFVAASRLAPGTAWLRRCLAASTAHLPQCRPADLPDLLSDLTALDSALFTRTAATAAAEGAAAAAAAPVTFTRSAAAAGSEAQGSGASALASPGLDGEEERGGELERLAAAWLRRYLQVCDQKLPLFTAAGVARLLLAVAIAGVRLEEAWLEAACAALASKVDVLAPTDLADAVTALAALRNRPTGHLAAAAATSKAKPVPTPRSAPQARTTTATQPRLAAAAAARQARQQQLLESLLQGCATKLSLLPNDRLVAMAAALADLDARPDPAWLRALLDETLPRLEASAVAVPNAGAPSQPPSMTPRMLSELLVAVAKMDMVPPRPWLRAALLAAGRQMRGFDAASLSGLVWALVVMDVQPPEAWTEHLLERVRTCLGEEGEHGEGMLAVRMAARTWAKKEHGPSPAAAMAAASNGDLRSRRGSAVAHGRAGAAKSVDDGSDRHGSWSQGDGPGGRRAWQPSPRYLSGPYSTSYHRRRHARRHAAEGNIGSPEGSHKE